MIINLRNNKGYTGIDISIAMIIILIFIPTIFGIVYNMQKYRTRTEREASALNIATDILELAKSLDYSNINFEDTGVLKEILNTKYSQSEVNSSIDINEDGYVYDYYTTIGTNNEHYRIQIGILKYFPENVVENNDGFVKKVKVIVTYPIGNSTKSINISTVLKNN